MNIKLAVTMTAMLTMLQTVSAHGGEEKAGLTNFQIMLISLLVSVIFYATSKKLTDINSNRNFLLTLVSYTGVVHILLGINDFVFLLGGLGVISVAMLPYLSKTAKEKEGVLDIILSIIVITMFIAYFVSNHDLHYILEDYLGVSTKLAEAGIIALVIKQSRSHSKQNNPSSN